MGLREYRRKRDFKKTAEPRGERVTAHKQLRFVVQKHAASHLHYDFRLELDGVLKSWAVPKGPSLDPAQKRLAMQVEDHPLEYGDFEGIIPQGQYGGGTVLLWDQGTWEPVEDGRKKFREGSLKFILHGEKLQGRWMLVRRGGKHADADERHWFLFKERDEFAKSDGDITAAMPRSVTTNRDLDQIARQAKRVWGPGGEVAQNGHAKRKSPGIKRTSHSAARNADSSAAKNGRKHAIKAATRSEIAKTLKSLGAKRAAFPRSPSVQLATLVEQAPAGDGWLHEIKFDGYRMLCRIDGGKTRFISRNGNDWTNRFPELTKAAGSLPVSNAILDGEVVVMQADGTTSFQALQNAFQNGAIAPFLYYVFDLLYLNGHDVRHLPLEDRKALLQQIVANDPGDSIQYSQHVFGNGADFFAEASRLRLEGIISKRRGQRYLAGRGLDWLKVKCSLQEEFVIGGFTAPSGARTHFGALLLGYYDGKKQLVYAGRVGTGFNDKTLLTLHERLAPLVRKESAFINLSGHTGQARGVTWVKPALVAQVSFSNWTKDRQLRHPSFQGLREDKPAKDVVRDDAVPAPAVESTRQAEKASTRKRAAPAVARKTPRKTGPDAESNEVAGVSLSHPDKVLYPDDGITKLDLAHYYQQVGSWMLPHVENRLLSLVRCPGSGQKCFFQKHPGEGTSEHFGRVKVKEKHKTEEYMTIDDLAGLVALVQMGVLEIHIWGSQADQFEKPDRLIFDLDPDPTVDWPRVVAAAKEVRLLLEDLGLVSFVKTTGGKGLHVVVPIRRRTSWDEAKAFCRAVAGFMTAAAPDRYLATMSKSARKGKIFVDYLRNDRGATAIAPYSTRARSGATVSVPIAWEELSARLKSDHFNIRNLPARLSKLETDPWADISKTSQAITASMLRKLEVR